KTPAYLLCDAKLRLEPRQVNIGSAAVAALLGSIDHGGETGAAVVKQFLIVISCLTQHIRHPVVKQGVDTVVNPLSLAAIQQQAEGAQLRQMTGNLRLRRIQRLHQLTDA